MQQSLALWRIEYSRKKRIAMIVDKYAKPFEVARLADQKTHNENDIRKIDCRYSLGESKK